VQRIILVFGGIAGAILSAMLLLTLPFADAIGFDHGAFIGYTTMIAAFLLIYFGVRSYRDNVAVGPLRFGRAFLVGASIATVASLCYVATWELIYFRIAPDYWTKYQAHAMAAARAGGADAATLARKQAELEDFGRMYQNPAFNAAITFLEPMPVALVIALVSAGVLTRRRGGRLAAA